MKINFIQKTFFAFMVGLLVLTSCNLPTSIQSTPTEDLMATEVSRLLTEVPAENMSSPSETPAPTEAPTTASPTETLPATVTFTPEPTLTATINPGDPRQVYGDPTWSDSLSNAKNFWKDENDHTKISEGDGVLLLTGKTTDGWRGWSLTYSQNPGNFYLEGVFRTQTCSGSDIYGLVFRAGKESSGYFLGFTCDGKYELRAIDFNANKDDELVAETLSPAILSGANQINRIGVLALGEKLVLYANGQLLEEVNDASFASGYIGAFVAGYATANFTVELDEISVWRLP